MAKKCALMFGIVGYLIVVWFNVASFRPLGEESTFVNVLLGLCPGCVAIDLVGGGIPWRATLVFYGPIQGLLYACIGFLLGKVVQELRENRGGQ